MIIGIGSDLIDIRRVDKVARAHGERFIQRIFTDDRDRHGPTGAATRAASYAKRFAAKEACAKALGTGMRAGRLLARHGRGQPAVRQADHGADRRRGRAARRADAGRPPAPSIHLTITDDFPLAQAFVIIEAVPDEVP